MYMSRRNILRRACATAIVIPALVAGLASAQAQTYPSQDIHFIAAFPAGSGSDIMVRFFAEKVRALSGRTIIVENKPGAGGNIAAEYVARAKPDGYTVLVHNGTSVAANYNLFKKPPINPSKDLLVAATITEQPFMLVVDSKSPYNTLPELTAAMKAKGDKATYAQATTFAKVMGELYRTAAGLEAVEVAYKSTPDFMNDLSSGAVDYAIMDPVGAMSHSKAGRVKVLAVSTPRRIQALPDNPTMKEAGADVELALWFGAMVPSGTPKPVVDQINTWMKEMVAMEDTKKFLIGIAGDPLTTTPAEGQAMLDKAQADWEGLVKAARIEPQG